MRNSLFFGAMVAAGYNSAARRDVQGPSVRSTLDFETDKPEAHMAMAWAPLSEYLRAEVFLPRLAGISKIRKPKDGLDGP